jgi:1,4-dihydroxy-2-naphthoate octaprenyltransferase
LSFGEVRRGIALALAVALLCAFWLVAASGSTAVVVGGALALLTTLALGYAVPPLKLCYRGLGELDVGLTHSPGAILCGFVLQGGAWHAGLPWLLSLPLFLAVLPSITLSGVPDLDADAAVGKRTLAVRTGVRGACAIAALSTLMRRAPRWRCSRCRRSGPCSPASSTASCRTRSCCSGCSPARPGSRRRRNASTG